MENKWNVSGKLKLSLRQIRSLINPCPTNIAKYNSSNISLRHRASSASLYQLQQQQQQQHPSSEKQIRRTSYMKPLQRIDPGKYLIAYDFQSYKSHCQITKSYRQLIYANQYQR